MSDYEDDIDEDLPSISLSQSTGEKSELEMPPAAEVASERAREAAAERALWALRAPPAAAPATPPDDGEAELLEAWAELRVDDAAGAGAARGERPRLPAALAALRQALPAGPGAALLAAHLRALRRAPHAADAIADQVLSGVTALLRRPGAAGAAGAAAWLLALAAAGGGGRARRALHRVLDAHATADQVAELGAAASAAWGAGAGGARALLAAHDAARSGAGRGADRLAAALLGAALRRALPPGPQAGERDPAPLGGTAQEPEGAPLSAATARRVRAAWRRLPARAQLLVLRGAGRALAAAPRAGPAADLLAALRQPLPRTDSPLSRQQVLSNVSKLQLLFRECADGGGEGMKDDAGEEGVRDERLRDDGASPGGAETSPERKRLRRSPRCAAHLPPPAPL